MGCLRGSSILNNMVWLFNGSRSLDSSWSWVVCFSAAVTSSINIGFTLSFGVFLPELMSYFNETIERTAFVGSAALGMTWFASPPVGYFIDRFGCRIASFLGGLLCIVGLLSTSFVQSLSYMYFTYSLVFGVGGCFLYNCCYLVIARYFKRNLSLATGIVAMGTSLGLTFQCPLLQCLLDSCGWRATVRVMTISFALVCLLSLTYNPNKDETPAEGNVNNTITKDEDDSTMNNKKIAMYCSVWLIPTYAFVVISLMFGSFGIYVPFIYLVKYCEAVGISAQKASRLFIFVGLSSSFGRLISGKLCNADRVNAVFIYQSSLLLAAICAFLLPFATKYREVIAFSVVYGLADGIFITTHGYILLSCIDSKRRTAAFAMNNVLFAIAAAAGGPIIGLIVDKTGNYIYSFYMTGGMLLTGFLIPMVLVILRRRRSRVGIVESKQVCQPDRKLSNNIIETQEVHYNSNGGHRTIQQECTA